MLARIVKYADLSWKDLTNIKRWFQREATREGFTLDSLNPSMKIAKATNSVGQTIAFCPIENCFVIGAFIQDPLATSVELGKAGDCIDAEVTRLAQREGVTKCFIALPDNVPTQPGERSIRVIERQITRPITTGGVISNAQSTCAQLN